MEPILSNLLAEIKVIINKSAIPIKTFIIGSNREHITHNTDIDIIVIVENTVDNFIFLEQVSQLVNDIIISNNILISIYPINESDYNNNKSEFILNIRKTGLEF